MTNIDGVTRNMLLLIYFNVKRYIESTIYTTVLIEDITCHAHVSLNLLNELGKIDKMRGFSSILSLFITSLINSIIQVHECYIIFII